MGAWDTELVPRATLDEILLHRDKALEEYALGKQHMEAAHAAAFRAARDVEHSYGFKMTGKWRVTHAGSLDAEEFRRDVDRAIWRYLIEASGLRTVMGSADLKRWDDQLKGDDVPEATYETITATMAKLIAESGDMFQRSVIECFGHLPRAYKTNNRFKFGEKIIFDGYHSCKYTVPDVSYYSNIGRALYDLERVMLTTDHRAPRERCEIIDRLTTAQGSYTQRTKPPWIAETEYFRVKVYQKGSAHVWLKREDLVQRLNIHLANHFGAALADDGRDQ